MVELNDNTILAAFSALGRKLKLPRDVEVLLVGGAAGVLIRALPPAWTTGDVDAIRFYLPQDRDAVLEAAEDVGRELSLQANWLNEDSGLFAWTLPSGWEQRKVHVGTFGHLRVFAVSRLDLIVMKFIANRPRDREHLSHMNVTEEELQHVRGRLALFAENYPQGKYPEEASKIAMAMQVVDNWEAPA